LGGPRRRSAERPLHSGFPMIVELEPGLASSQPAVAGWERSLARRPLHLPSRRSASGRRFARFTRRAVAAAAHRQNVAVLTLALLLMSVFALAALTLPAVAVLGLGVLYYGTAVITQALCPSLANRLDGPPGPPHEPEVTSDEFDSPELRVVYESILTAHEAIRRTLRASERVRDSFTGLYVRCGELVDLAGRTALLGEDLDRYLDTQSTEALAAEVERLEARAAQAVDLQAGRVYREAAKTRGRQLGARRELEALRERVGGRLEAIHSSFDWVESLIVKLRALDQEQVATAGDPSGDHFVAIREELGLLEAAIDETLED
jgi:hypothetical protein